MKAQFHSFWIALGLLTLQSPALPVDEAVSIDVASKFFRKTAIAMQAQDTSLASIDFSQLAIRTVTVHGNPNDPSFYTVQFDPQGWVIISADDAVVPVLGYSFTGNAPVGDSILDIGVGDLLSQYAANIDTIKTLALENPFAREIWDELLSDTLIPPPPVSDTAEMDTMPAVFAGYQPVMATTIVNTLLTTKWNQSSPWNMYAPASSGPGGHSYAGCGAVSTAQVMNFYEFPSSGTGANNNYDFSMATYDYSAMPDEVSSTETAKLLRHVGAAVNMRYGATGSSSYTRDIALALKNYFKYHSDAEYVQRSVLGSTAWLEMLKSELDAGRPVIYEGFGNGSGHSFVIDGYNSSNYFHMNYGWSGYSDGWFSLGDITPGSYNFTNSQGAIRGVRPGQYIESKGQVFASATKSGEILITGDLKSWVPFSSQPTWTSIPSTLTSLASGDLDGDGAIDDLVGRTTKGLIVSTTNLSTWTTLRTGMKSVITADLDGDGKMNDLAGISSTNQVWYRLNQGEWTLIAGAVGTILATIDLDGDGIKDDLVLANSSLRKIYFTTDKSTWTNTTYSYSGFVVGDFDGDEVEDDLIAWQSTYDLWINTDQTTWVRKTGKYNSLATADFDGDGILDDLYGRNSKGQVFYQLQGDTSWNSVPGAVVSRIYTMDIDSDGKRNDVIGVSSSGVVLYSVAGIGPWTHLNLAQKFLAPIDLDKDGKLDDLAAMNTKGAVFYTDKVSETWIGATKMLISLDTDQDGKSTELVVLDNLGDLFYSNGRKNWERIPAPEPITSVIAISMDGNSAKEGIAAIGKSKKLYVSSDLEEWVTLPITPYAMHTGDADGDGIDDDLFVIASNKSIWKTTNYTELSQITGTMKIVKTADLDGDGKEDDMLAIATDSKLYKRIADSTIWTYTRVTVRDFTTYDANSDGKRESIAAMNTGGRIMWSTNAGSTWTYGTMYFKAIWTAALDEDGIYNDIVGLHSTGKLYYTKDRMTWTLMSSNILTATVGSFTAHIDDTEGTLVETASVAIKPNNSSLKAGWISAEKYGEYLQIQSTIHANIQATWVNVAGKSIQLGTIQIAKGQVQNISLKKLAPNAGAGWIVLRSGTWIHRIPLVMY